MNDATRETQTQRPEDGFNINPELEFGGFKLVDLINVVLYQQDILENYQPDETKEVVQVSRRNGKTEDVEISTIQEHDIYRLRLRRLIRFPLPQGFIEQYPETLSRLFENHDTYEDIYAPNDRNLEDIISEDGIMTGLLSRARSLANVQKPTLTKNADILRESAAKITYEKKQLSKLIAIRRNVIAILAHELNIDSTAPIPEVLPVTNCPNLELVTGVLGNRVVAAYETDQDGVVNITLMENAARAERHREAGESLEAGA